MFQRTQINKKIKGLYSYENNPVNTLLELTSILDPFDLLWLILLSKASLQNLTYTSKLSCSLLILSPTPHISYFSSHTALAP